MCLQGLWILSGLTERRGVPVGSDIQKIVAKIMSMSSFPYTALRPSESARYPRPQNNLSVTTFHRCDRDKKDAPKANCPMTLPMLAAAFMKPSRTAGKSFPPYNRYCNIVETGCRQLRCHRYSGTIECTRPTLMMKRSYAEAIGQCRPQHMEHE